ncbi:MAG: hypothetical protein FJW68_07235 [Actinobacteria bacterium]|nr:hypothetical protein [Actinomycetota bacterium]
MAGIRPLVIAAGGMKYPDKKNFVISVIILCSGTKGLSAPWIFSYILEKSSLFTAMKAVYLFLVLSFAVSAALVLADMRKAVANSKN